VLSASQLQILEVLSELTHKMKDDLNYIVKLEKAIKQKYGEEAIKNPASQWDSDKEKKYLEQIEDYYKKIAIIEDKQTKVDQGGFLVNKKLLTREIINICSVCEKRAKTAKDDVCINKFQCCEKCFIEFVEGREQRWLQGWRPKDA
jgi:hypothetical protein